MFREVKSRTELSINYDWKLGTVPPFALKVHGWLGPPLNGVAPFGLRLGTDALKIPLMACFLNR